MAGKGRVYYHGAPKVNSGLSAGIRELRAYSEMLDDRYTPEILLFFFLD